MITGIAVLGVLAGSLASFFRLESADAEVGEAPSGSHDEVGRSREDDLHGLNTALNGLVREVGELRRQVEALNAGSAGDSPTAP